MADSGVDDDRLAPVPAAAAASLGGRRSETPHDPIGHGTAVASMLVANRPDVGVVGIVPDATLLSARIVKSKTVLQSDHARARPRWRRSAGCAGMARRSSTSRPRRKPSRALIESLRALQLSGALVVAAVGNGGHRAEPAGSPPRSPACSASASWQPGSSTQVAKESTRGSRRRSRGAGGGDQGHRVERRRESASAETAITPDGHVVLGADRDGRGGDGVGDAPRLDGSRGRECARAQRHAARQGRRRTATGATAASNVSHALRAPRLPDSHEPNDWVAAALWPSGRCARAPWWSPASAGPATTSTPTRSTCPRARRRGPCCGSGGAGVTLRRCCRSTRPTPC